MSDHTLTKRSDYHDVVHRRFAGTPLEIAGKELQQAAQYPHLGWGFYAQDFEHALKAYVKAGGALPITPKERALRP